MDDTRDIEEIRADIAHTRARLRDTSEALGHKADLPARTMSLVGDAAELAGEWLRGRVPPPRQHEPGRNAGDGDGPGLMEQAGDAISSAAGSASGAVAEGASSAVHAVAGGAQAAAAGVARAAGTAASGVKAGATRAADHVPDADDARAHPMLVAALALAAGMAAGLAIPASRAEERAAQPLADEARDAADRLAERAGEAVRAI